jgi:hypothetical protein
MLDNTINNTVPLTRCYTIRHLMCKPTFRPYQLFSLLLLVSGSFSLVLSACQTDGSVVRFISNTKQTVDLATWEIPNHATAPVELFERSEPNDVHSGHRELAAVFRPRLDWCDLSVSVFVTFLPVAQQLFLRFCNLRH